MSDPGFDVAPFSEASFYEALSNEKIRPSGVAHNRVAQYLFGYLQELGARSIVTERRYTDGDYLDDYANYYVKCYEDYERHCKRLHFFGTEYSKESFASLIQRPLNPDALQKLNDDYRGSVVARPLPEAIVGRTVLKTYDDDAGRRNYLCLRRYPVNLFGIDLKVDSLAFQEQDTVLAACATVALWSAFEMTSSLFEKARLTPSEITMAASKAIHYGRPIPSHGLRVLEMCSAIKHAQLEPELYTVKATTPLNSLIYSYLKMRIPVILGVEIKGHGLHAITIGGCSILSKQVLKREAAQGADTIPMVGLRVDEFYAHDDQVGPFSRLVVMPARGKVGRQFPVYFEGDWLDDRSGKPCPIYPVVVIVPLYHKIRINFLEAMNWVTSVNAALGSACSKVIPNEKVEWDIHLKRSNDFKIKLGSSDPTERERLSSILVKDHPRFVWSARATVAGKCIVEFLLDATGIARSFPMYIGIWHRQDVLTEVKRVITEPAHRRILLQAASDEFWEELAKKI